MGQILVHYGIQITDSALAFTSSKMGSHCKALSKGVTLDFLFYFFNLIFILYWSIRDLQCCVSVVCTHK